MENQEVREEIAKLAARMDNTEAYFDNFDKALNNHMTEMVDQQKKIDERLTKLEALVAKMQGASELAVLLIKFVILPLIGILAGLVGIKLIWPAA